MKYIAIIVAILALGGCVAGQRYAECDKEYPPPPNTWLLRNGQSGDAVSGLINYFTAKAIGEDEQAYNNWKQSINACINEQTAEK